MRIGLLVSRLTGGCFWNPPLKKFTVLMRARTNNFKGIE